MDQASFNRELIKHHFEALNRRDVATVVGNMRPNLIDHDLQGDHTQDLQEGSLRLKELMDKVPDLTVDVRDIIADSENVVVRGVWFGTEKGGGQKVEFHGFVQFKVEDGKFAERWATVTPSVPLRDELQNW